MKKQNSINNPKLTEAKETLKNLKGYRKIEAKYDEWIKTKPEKALEDFEKLVVAINKIDANQHMEKLFAEEQMSIIEKNWIGKAYPKEYLGRKDHKFWKAKNATEKRSCGKLLSKMKGWRATEYPNNFWMVFLEYATVYSAKLSKDEFKELGVSTNHIAKLYACILAQRIASGIRATVMNESVLNRFPGGLKEFFSLVNQIENKIEYADLVEEKIRTIFDKLVLEYGYNPKILAG